MSLHPKVRRILTPAPLAPNVLALQATSNPQQLLQSAAQQSLDPSCSQQLSTTTIQRLTTLHPNQPLVAYMLCDQQSTDITRRLLIVQHTRTKQILYRLTLVDLAMLLYGEPNPQKLPAATKSLGNVVSLQFLDPHTLYWSGMMSSSSQTSQDSTTTTTSSSSSSSRWSSLAVQTSHRILVLNLQQPFQGLLIPKQKPSISGMFQAHLGESTIGAIPSSNLLMLSQTWWLVGCADGSLKCFDAKSQSVVKSIKGLGKNDWIVLLQAANRYSNNSNGDLQGPRRILTVTKRGICYLIELEQTADHLEIKPPLARFMGGMPEHNISDSSMEHSLLNYDAHRDLILWLAPAKQQHNNKSMILYVWNLQSLQTDLVQQQSGTKNLFKPDPTLSVHFPTSTETSLTALSLVHAAFAEDTILIAIVTAMGELHLMGVWANPNNAVSSVTATPILAVPLSLLIQNDAALDYAPVLRVHALASRPLLSSELVIATNMGLVVLELPVPTLPGARHLHFGAGLGSLGKSVLSVQSNSNVMYGSLDVLKPNPVGRMQAKNPMTVYESPPGHHLPAEIQKRPFRLAPVFVPSPSGLYLCLFWPAEFRYEVLHTASVLQKVGQRGNHPNHHHQSRERSPAVASGQGVVNFAWVGDNDVFAVLYAPDLVQQGIELMTPVTKDGSHLNLQQFTNLKDIRASAKNLAQSAKAATSATLSVTKAATTATLSATKAATSSASKVVKTANKGVKKSFGLFGGKKKKGAAGAEEGSSIMDMTEDEVSETPSSIQTPMTPPASMSVGTESVSTSTTLPTAAESKRRYVELWSLVAVESQSSEISGSIAAATSSSLGELTLRGGNRNPPTVIFGGPVLCVASKSEEDPEGHAYFYTRKKDGTDQRASAYVSSGPTLPYPDFCAWDDDGRLCAIVVQNRVAIYLSNAPDFVLLGCVRIGSADAEITNVRFVHGVLYCCAYNSVHCVFLGNVEEGICKLDTYKLASTDVPMVPDKSCLTEYKSLTPPTVPLPLVQPVVLGYQNGSLVISTVRGLQAIPLSHPMLRIGTLLASGQVDRASKWFDAVPNSDHEALASFLERRGYQDLALDLPGISLETIVDMSMRSGDIDRLEEVVESYGVKGLRAIDMGRGLSPSFFGPEGNACSTVVCVGAYLLAHGSAELARRLASECLRSGEEGRKDAFALAALLLSLDEADGTRLIGRAVDEGDVPDDWIIGQYARDFVLN